MATDGDMHLGYEVHPACALLPLMGDDALAEMAHDIKTNGLRQPIVLHDGKLLDGRNRLLACKMAGVEPAIEEFEGHDPVAWVLSLNFQRRHLTDTQKAVVGAKAERLLLARAQAAIPAEPTTSETTAAEPEAQVETPAEPAKSEAPDPKRVAKDVRRTAATLVNVSERAIAKGKKLIDRGVPELVEAVEVGVVPLAAANTVAELEAPRQREVVAEGPEFVRVEAKRLSAERRAGRPPSVPKALKILDGHCPDYLIEKSREGRFIFKATVMADGDERVIETEAFSLRDVLVQACSEAEALAGSEA